jgi:hypothetical protein
MAFSTESANRGQLDVIQSPRQLRDQNRREMIYAKNLPRNLPASCLGELRTIFGSV